MPNLDGTPTVLEIKATVRERDGHRCTQCGMTHEAHVQQYGKTLDVHRLCPGSPYAVEGCVTLCKTCHGPQPKSPRLKPRQRAETVQLTFRVPDELSAQTAALSRRLGLNVSNFLRLMLAEKLPAYERQASREEVTNEPRPGVFSPRAHA